jgi:predicted house-cleaning noncanonical NTP pyrophosphatase (MazG superfamily)
MPLYDTRIEKELAATGRLCIRDGIGDYDFEEAPMNLYYDFVTDCFSEWLRYPEGVENISKWARNYLLVYKYYYSQHPKGIELQEEIKKIISDSNLFLLDTMKNISDIFESGMFNKEYLEKCREDIKVKHDQFKKEIIVTMGRLLSFVEDNK